MAVDKRLKLYAVCMPRSFIRLSFTFSFATTEKRGIRFEFFCLFNLFFAVYPAAPALLTLQ
jgi:hypothetical protein